MIGWQAELAYLLYGRSRLNSQVDPLELVKTWALIASSLRNSIQSVSSFFFRLAFACTGY